MMSKKLNLRNDRLVKDIIEGELSYREIGEIYGVTKQRVFQFAKENNISRWKNNREVKLKLKNDIQIDIIKGLSYEEITSKYSYKNTPLTSVINMSLHRVFLGKRNKEILNLYKTMTAKEAINIPVSALSTPYKIKSVNDVYKIASQQGYKKYSNVGDRYKGGCFEDKKVTNLIKRLRNKGLKYREIKEELNKKGIKTITGKSYSTPNIRRVYSLITKSKK
jgi:Trp operon repressor